VGEHLLVEVDVAGRPEDDVDQDVVLEPLEQPERVGLLRGEPSCFQCLQGEAGVLGADEQVDVVGPPGAAERIPPMRR